jgi:ubiquinone/menaquinone biosynthesis C-methylase UbiE
MQLALGRRLERAAYRTQQLSFFINSSLLQETARVLARHRRPAIAPDSARMLRRRYFELLDRDLANVAAGLYPRDLLFGIPVRDYARALPALIADAPSVVRRMRRRDWRDLPAEVDLERYPPYYRRTFHWQSDGYLSPRSARMYDLGVELLFRGTADVMRRQIIPHITRHIAGRPAASLRLLDVACGTGRPLDQIAVAHPQLRLHGVDLSPFYVARARQRLSAVAELTLAAENGEELPFVDRHFDVVTSVYLFHELPRNARRRVVAEMFRVLAPGGLVVIEDSAQLADSGDLADTLTNFPAEFHEPFYRDYMQDDLAALLREQGFAVIADETHLVARVIAARKT